MGVLIISMIALIGVDQLCKILIVSNLQVGQEIKILFLNLCHIQNYSVFFGKSLNILFAIISIIVLGVFVNFFLKKYAKKVRSKFNFLPFILILSGGCSNIIDRFARGFVVDYIEIPSILKDIVFNFADIYISIGIILLIALNAIKITDEKVDTMSEQELKSRNSSKVWNNIWNKKKK